MWVSVSGTVMAQATLAGHMSQEDLEDTRGCCLLRIIPDEVSLSKISSTELAPWPLCVCATKKMFFTLHHCSLFFGYLAFIQMVQHNQKASGEIWG